MREILFRGKRIDNGEWVYGNLNILNGCVYHIVPLQVYIHTSGIPASEFYDVDPDTISEYTGLTDKNGKKIFEGDIVRNHTGGVYEVAFIKQYSRFALRRPRTVFCWSNPKHCEVIGNIHDNPELLEGA